MMKLLTCYPGGLGERIGRVSVRWLVGLWGGINMI